MKETKRKTVGSRIYAKHVYPELGSEKSAAAVMVNLVLSDDEALNLARHLVQAARCAKELTLAAVRKPSVKKHDHAVTVTYEVRMEKQARTNS
jgi:hypothetical protein